MATRLSMCRRPGDQGERAAIGCGIAAPISALIRPGGINARDGEGGPLFTSPSPLFSLLLALALRPSPSAAYPTRCRFHSFLSTQLSKHPVLSFAGDPFPPSQVDMFSKALLVAFLYLSLATSSLAISSHDVLARAAANAKNSKANSVATCPVSTTRPPRVSDRTLTRRDTDWCRHRNCDRACRCRHY